MYLRSKITPRRNVHASDLPNPNVVDPLSIQKNSRNLSIETPLILKYQTIIISEYESESNIFINPFVICEIVL